MRRTVVLLALPAALLTVPAQPASAACVSSTGVTVCPTVFTCGRGSVVEVTGVGLDGYVAASCGGVTADCTVFLLGCNAIATASGPGVLTCFASGRAVATCSVTPSANAQR